MISIHCTTGSRYTKGEKTGASSAVAAMAGCAAMSSRTMKNAAAEEATSGLEDLADLEVLEDVIHANSKGRSWKTERASM